MKPEDKVVSLETARKLKDAGFPQEDMEHWWHEKVLNFIEGKMKGGKTEMVLGQKVIGNFDCAGHMAAPDAQEVGDQLPACITQDGVNRYLNCEKDCYDDASKPQMWHWSYR